MLEKLKSNLIYILIISILLFVVYDLYNRSQDKKIKQEYVNLVNNNNKLMALIEDQKQHNQKLATIIEDQKIVISIAQKNSDIAIARLEKLEKVHIITPTNDVPGVTDFLYKFYNDNDVQYDKSRFSIKDTTVFPLVTDAKEWKINGPILTTNLSETTKALSALKITDSNKTIQLENYDHRIDGLVNQNNLSEQLLSGKDGQITLLNKELKIQHRSAIITHIKVGFTCAFAGWAYDRFRRK